MTVCDSQRIADRSKQSQLAIGFSLALASYPSVKYIIESELVKESIVRGHHIYKEMWSPVIGELLPVLQETINVHDRRSVAVFRDVNILAHVPRELSNIFWFFLN